MKKKNTSDSSLTNEAAPVYHTSQNTKGQTPAVSLEKPKTILKSTDTVSFSASLLSIEADIEKEEAEKANVPKTPVTLERVNAFWQEYTEEITSTSVKTAFSSAILSLDDNNIIIKAAGTFNKSSIESERIKVFNFLKQKFRTQDLLLTIIMDEVLAAQQAQKVEAKRPMTHREKFIKMGEANKLIYDLRKRFDLRPDN